MLFVKLHFGIERTVMLFSLSYFLKISIYISTLFTSLCTGLVEHLQCLSALYSVQTLITAVITTPPPPPLQNLTSATGCLTYWTSVGGSDWFPVSPSYLSLNTLYPCCPFRRLRSKPLLQWRHLRNEISHRVHVPLCRALHGQEVSERYELMLSCWWRGNA